MIKNIFINLIPFELINQLSQRILFYIVKNPFLFERIYKKDN